MSVTHFGVGVGNVTYIHGRAPHARACTGEKTPCGSYIVSIGCDELTFPCGVTWIQYCYVLHDKTGACAGMSNARIWLARQSKSV